METDVIVIGGGPAGMMAACQAAGRGLSVTLIEKNEKLGKKLFITGKGRCNLTNASGIESFFNAERSNPKFLYSAFNQFSNTDLCALIESAGCRLKTERGGRVFPLSDHSSDVIKALKTLLTESGVTLMLLCRVSGISKSGDIFTVKSTGGDIKAKSVIVATGGLSYPETGSTGDGYAFAKGFGLEISPLSPSLCPLKLKEETQCKSAAGLTLKNVGLKIKARGKILFEDRGELLITHTGLSGPLALTASSFVSGTDFKEPGVTAHIDLKPALSKEVLNRRLLREIEKAHDRELKNFMRALLPASLIGVILSRAGLDPFKRAGDLRKDERMGLIDVMKDLSFNVTGTGGFDEAVVTRGGVAVSELNPATMESKKVPGLYFAGEVIDIDALTGGYNLQNAFSTGFAAGSHVLSSGLM